MILLLEIGSMSAAVMQLHHFMFKDSNLVKSGKDKKISEKLKKIEEKTLLSQVES